MGSGSVFARGSLKKRWRAAMSSEDAIRTAVEALVDAADDDSATGGPDTVRQIWPIVVTVSAEGYQRVPEAVLRAVVDELESARRAQGHRGGGSS